MGWVRLLSRQQSKSDLAATKKLNKKNLKFLFDLARFLRFCTIYTI